MEHATAADYHARAYQQWCEAVELGLHGSEDIVCGIVPLLVEGLELEPEHLPSLDLLSDMLMEIGDYQEAVELVEKMLDLASGDADYLRKRAVLADEVDNRRRVVRAYLHQKRLRLTREIAGR